MQLSTTTSFPVDTSSQLNSLPAEQPHSILGAFLTDPYQYPNPQQVVPSASTPPSAPNPSQSGPAAESQEEEEATIPATIGSALLIPSVSQWRRRTNSFVTRISAQTMKKREIGVAKSPNWVADEWETLLAILSQESQYARMKFSTGDTFWDEIALECFYGTRTGNAVKQGWERLKKKFTAAQKRIRATGEGERDEQTWNEFRGGWLGKECPYYAEVADILQRDKTFTPPMASDVGGVCKITFAVPTAAKADVEEDATPFEWDTSDHEGAETQIADEEDHPPQGGKKDPHSNNQKRKRGLDLGALDEIPEQILRSQKERKLDREERKRDRQEDLELRREEFQFRKDQALQKEEREAKQRAHEMELQDKKLQQLEMELRLAEMRKGT